MIKTVGIAAISVSLLAGCAGLSDTDQRLLTGGAAGAAGGALIGALSGEAAWGAGIGAAAGLAGGFLYDRHVQAEQEAYRQGYAAGASQ